MKPTPLLTAEDLSVIRQHTDCRQLFNTLRVEKDPRKSRKYDWWGKSPFRPHERSASFHMQADGRWYCHATGQGGGAIELVQRLHGLNCYEAGRWLLEHGVSQIVGGVRHELEVGVPRDEGKEEVQENRPIQVDLRPYLSHEHPEFERRAIPASVLEELGVGYLERRPRKDGKPDPLNQRLVFQIRGIVEPESGAVEPVILSHIGRATTTDQEQKRGKWYGYSGFRKSLELYNLDYILLDDEATAQIIETGHVLVVEGCFDVAKLYAAGIRNVVATFGTHLSAAQLRHLDLISEIHGVDHFTFFYDRDQAGRAGMEKVLQIFTGAFRTIRELGYPSWVADLVDGRYAHAFDWEQTFGVPSRGVRSIPTTITDPCEFSVEQLRWLRAEGLI